MPGNIFTKMEGKGEFVFRNLPGFCQFTFQLQVFIVTNQAVVDLAVDIT